MDSDCVDGSGDGRRGGVGDVLVSRQAIAQRVAELGREIATVYEGQELTVVAVLSGALVFLADLIRHIPGPVRIVPVVVHSYLGASMTPACKPRLGSLPELPASSDVLIVDDILDTGQTLAALAAHCREQADSVRICVLLGRKQNFEKSPVVRADFVGFDIGKEFVVGYGMDYDGLYRNLPDIRILRTREGQ
jgi:hypoxanthine phosphoribosyltransferase